MLSDFIRRDPNPIFLTIIISRPGVIRIWIRLNSTQIRNPANHKHQNYLTKNEDLPSYENTNINFES